MRIILYSFFCLILLAACRAGVPPTPTAGLPTSIPVTSTPEPTATPQPTPTPARLAIISEVLNEVTARELDEDDFSPALVGAILHPGGGAQTGEEGRARLDLKPDFSIVRLGSNSSFTVQKLAQDDGQSLTRLELFFGKVFILLNGGSLEVCTPSGLASVRGSLMSVEYDPELNKMEIGCLEGYCTLENTEGILVELIAGQSSYIIGQAAPVKPVTMNRQQILDWLDQAPELSEFTEQMPAPEDYPEWQEYSSDEQYQNWSGGGNWSSGGGGGGGGGWEPPDIPDEPPEPPPWP